MRQVRHGPIGRFLQLIRFSHTIFALPFALAALIVAANGWPSLKTFLLVIQFLVALSLIVIVLMQKSKGEGLGSIGGGGQMFFNKAKGIDRALERATTIVAVLFMVLSILLSVIL